MVDLRASALAYGGIANIMVVPLCGFRDGRTTCGRLCNHPGKHPLTEHGYRDGSADLAEIGETWNRMPDSNVGLCTLDMLVIDIDSKKGGLETLTDLEREHGPLPTTVRVFTGMDSEGRRGEHRWYRRPAGKVRRGAEALGPGVDVITGGPFIVGPPSMHACGLRYEFATGPIPTDELPACPGWVEGLLAVPTRLPRIGTASAQPRVGNFRGLGPIGEIKAALSVAEFALRFTDLRPSGPGRLSGLCPIHSELKPSFTVFTDQTPDSWYCFGCSRGGDVYGLGYELRKVGRW